METAGFHSACCVSEDCAEITQRLLLRRTRQLGGATSGAPPEALAEEAARILTSAAEEPRNLTEPQRRWLDEQAARHDGLVPTQGRSFGNWLHAVWPRACPKPLSKGAKPPEPETFVATGNKVLLLPREVQLYLNRADEVEQEVLEELDRRTEERKQEKRNLQNRGRRSTEHQEGGRSEVDPDRGGFLQRRQGPVSPEDVETDWAVRPRTEEEVEEAEKLDGRSDDAAERLAAGEGVADLSPEDVARTFLEDGDLGLGSVAGDAFGDPRTKALAEEMIVVSLPKDEEPLLDQGQSGGYPLGYALSLISFASAVLGSVAQLGVVSAAGFVVKRMGTQYLAQQRVSPQAASGGQRFDKDMV